MSTEYVKVLVIARQRVSYRQVLAFRKEEWEEFKKLDSQEAGDELTDRLDLRNVNDAEDIEDDFEAVVVGDDGKPLDEYAEQ